MIARVDTDLAAPPPCARKDGLLTTAPPEMSVLEARDLYLSENGFTIDEYTNERGWLIAAGFRIEFPNSADRRRLLPRHDLHHVALGFGTSQQGELEVSAWELRAGLPGTDAQVRLLVGFGVLSGLILCPLRTIAAWRANRARRSLITHPLPYDELLGMTVGELRDYLGIPRTGLVSEPQRAHRDAPVHAKRRRVRSLGRAARAA
jgi:hypothetical protein